MKVANFDTRWCTRLRPGPGGAIDEGVSYFEKIIIFATFRSILRKFNATFAVEECFVILTFLAHVSNILFIIYVDFEK